jgi:putative sterol carrier protein
LEVFTQAWAEAFRDRINESGAYRRHGATWRAPIALEMSFTGGAEPRAVLLDLSDGRCHGALCSNEDGTKADLVIRSSVEGWQNLLAGRLDPIWALMSGRLRLVRGNLSELVPYAHAAKALVEAAASVEASFPPREGP